MKNNKHKECYFLLLAALCLSTECFAEMEAVGSTTLEGTGWIILYTSAEYSDSAIGFDNGSICIPQVGWYEGSSYKEMTVGYTYRFAGSDGVYSYTVYGYLMPALGIGFQIVLYDPNFPRPFDIAILFKYTNEFVCPSY